MVRERILARIQATIDRGDFLNGSAVSEFEQRFAEYLERNHCVGVSSGLDALRLSLLASGLAPGSGVIVPASTFAATFEAVIQAGGTPVVVDVSDVQVFPWGSFVFFQDPDGNGWALQAITHRQERP